MDILKTDYHPSLRARISHELRIPITQIIGTIDLLRDTTVTHTQQAHLNCIQDCAERLLIIQMQIDQLFKTQGTKKVQLDEA